MNEDGVSTVCPFCNSENTILIKNQFKFFGCNECLCIFNSEFQNDKKSLLTKSISYSNSPSEKFKKIISMRFWNLISKEYIKYLNSNANNSIKSALDVGALYGHLVEKLNQQNIDAYGIEVDKSNIDKGISKKIFHGFFDENFTSEKKYDLICLTQMIYYVEKPIELLKNSINLLNDDGLIFISTQNPDSSIIKNHELPIFENGMNILFSKKNFEDITNTLNLKILDFTNFRPNIYLDRLKNGSIKNEFFNFLKYMNKPSFEKSNDGHHSFLLLQKL
jgi:SAM-dependent methyltransferase